MRRALLLALPFLLAACATPPAAWTPEQQAEANAWFQEVSARIRSKTYFPRDPNSPLPPDGGRVAVRVTVNARGETFTPQLQQSSGNPLLDGAALTTALAAAPLLPPPAFLLNPRGFVTLTQPINFVVPRPMLSR